MSTTMDIPEESQIHLKRNRACLQCKKRKVKCDGVRPVCLPCTRTANSARRGSDAAPTEIQCTWADEVHGHQDEGGQSARPGVSRKKVSGRVVTQEKVDVQASRVATLEAERDSFKARLEQLEARLAALSTPSSQTSYPINQGSDPTDTLPKPAVDPFAPFGPGVCPLFGTKLDMNTAPDPLLLGPAPAPGWSLPPELDFTQFFVIPSHWPKNLPAPYLLEHLIDTFFNCVPQAPRILHRAKLLRRLQLQPNHPNFPLPALLHAICAAAAPHTAWVNSLPPGAVYGSVNRIYETEKDLEESEDFGLSQAEASRRAYHQGHHRLWLSQGDWAVQNLQTQALLMGVWHSRGLFGAGGACLGDANRLIKELELTNRIHRREGINSWINPPTSDIDREERLGVVWYIFMFEAFSAVGSYWSVGLDDRLLLCSLPAGSQEFQGAEDRIQENPQDARSPDLFTVHPIADPYVLACKAALLSARVRRALNEWTQRRPVEGDKLLGMEKDDFRSVYRDTILFQQSIPDSIKHIFRVLNSGSHRVIDYNVLAVHLMPNLSILMLFEPFVVWDQPHAHGLPHILKAIDGVMSVIHHIPSNFDITLGMNGVLTYNLQVCAQFINQLIEHAVAKQAYAQAIRYRTDFTSIKDLLKRLGGKHAVAYYSTAVLEGTLQWRSEGFSLSEDLSASQDNTPSPPNGTSTTTTTSLDIMPDIAFGSNNGSVYVDPHMVAPAPATHQPSFSIEGQIIHPQPEQDIAPTASFMPFDQGNNNHMAVFTGLPIPHLPSNVPIQPLLTPGVQPMSTYPLVYPSTGLDPGAPVDIGSVPIATDLNGISAAQLAEVYGSLAGERNTFAQS